MAPLIKGRKFISFKQHRLYKYATELFPSEEVLMDCNHKDLRYSATDAPIQLDIYIPSLNLAFEYQGEQHYGHHFLYGSSRRQQRRDNEKIEKCDSVGITLIEIRYWWDGQKSSLAATIHQYRSDLLKEQLLGVPIPNASIRAIDMVLKPKDVFLANIVTL